MSEKNLQKLLKGHKFCLLTTFRKDGRAVPTPMWFAMDDDALYMATLGNSAKIRRLRHQPKVLIAPCTSNGRPLGPALETTARIIVDPEAMAKGEKLLRKRYGLKRRVFMWGMKFAKDKTRAMIAVPVRL